jgi:hypothetical protein
VKTKMGRRGHHVETFGNPCSRGSRFVEFTTLREQGNPVAERDPNEDPVSHVLYTTVARGSNFPFSCSKKERMRT